MNQDDNVRHIEKNQNHCTNRNYGPCWISATPLGPPVLWKRGVYRRECRVCGAVYEFNEYPPLPGSPEAQRYIDRVSVGMKREKWSYAKSAMRRAAVRTFGEKLDEYMAEELLDNTVGDYTAIEERAIQQLKAAGIAVFSVHDDVVAEVTLEDLYGTIKK